MKQRAAGRRAEQRHGVVGGLLLGGRRGELLGRDEAGQGGHVGGVVEDEQGAFQRRGGVELGEGEAPQPGGQRDAAEGEGARGVAAQHEVPAVPAVYQRAGRQGEQREGGGTQGAGHAGQGGRARTGQDQEREGQAGEAGAEGGDALAAPEQQVGPVAPERRQPLHDGRQQARALLSAGHDGDGSMVQ